MYVLNAKRGLAKLMATVVLSSAFAGSAVAQQDLSGVWQGKLETAPGQSLTIQFTFTKAADGSYSAVLNSPDTGAIKNAPASAVAVDGGNVKVDVASLSGAYAGTVKDGTIEGTWSQQGTSFPLNLSPYVKPVLSKENIAALTGDWNGKLSIGNLTLPIVFRFQTNDKGEFVAFLDSPDQGAKDIPVTDVELVDGNLSLRVPAVRGEYKGRMGTDEIVGEWSQGQPMALTVKKGAYVPEVKKLDLAKEAMDVLEGKWQGKLSFTNPAGKAIELTMVFRFEHAADGTPVGFIQALEQGGNGVPMSEASLKDGKLMVRAAPMGAEFNGQLSGDKVEGQWSQGPMNVPLSLVKG